MAKSYLKILFIEEVKEEVKDCRARKPIYRIKNDKG